MATIQCIICGAPNPDKASFCDQCGRKLMLNTCTNGNCENHIQSTPLSPKALYCNACGSQTTLGIIKSQLQRPDTGTENDSQLFEQAVEMALDAGELSTSGLQRRLRLGYAKAGRMMDEMERKGILSGSNGSKPRQVLITQEQWQQMKQDRKVAKIALPD